MKFKALYDSLNYEVFAQTAKVLDIFYEEINRAFAKKDFRALHLLLKDCDEWFGSINKIRLNWTTDAGVLPTTTVNVNRAFKEVGKLLDFVKEKTRKLEREAK